MKKWLIGIMAAVMLSVASPSFANIVWATFGPGYCTDYWGTYTYISENFEGVMQWFLFYDYHGFSEIQLHGSTPQAVMDYVGAQYDGCEF